VETVDESADDAIAVVSLSGELDAADPTWADEIDAVLDSGADRLVVDLRNVTFIDSSVVRLLVLAQRRVAPDGWLHLVYTHHMISRVLQICGLADAFPQFTTVHSALRSTPTRVASHRSAASGDEIRRAADERRLTVGADALGRSDDDQG
jgi:stage II sporulation protein AA (anti-sigma F factor antagonist)